jgi:cytochrome bd-type quinol oxidase subunit 1
MPLASARKRSEPLWDRIDRNKLKTGAFVAAFVLAAAISAGHEIWKNIVESAGGKVTASDPEVSTQANANSFQVVRKLSSAPDTTPGLESGIMTRVKA